MEDLFAGEKRLGLQFPKLGTEYKGCRVLSMQQEEQKDLEGETKTWSDGKPMMQIVIELQVPGIEELGVWDKHTEEWVKVDGDDGRRFMFCSGGLFTAMKNARKEIGFPIQEDSLLDVKFIKTVKPSNPAWNPRKIYEATYTKPVEEDPFSV